MGGPPWAVFVTCVLSHLPMLPTVVLLYRKRMPLECVAGLFSVIVSFMYHLCETFDCIILLSELRWHRLDNVGAISSLGATFLHLACLNQLLTDYLKCILFTVVLVLQEWNPWNEICTAVPVAVCIAVPVVSHLANKRRRLRLYLRRLLTGIGFFLLSLIFFVLGLDDANDPLRMFHGLFHVSVAVGMFSFWVSFRPTFRRTSDYADIGDTTVVLLNT